MSVRIRVDFCGSGSRGIKRTGWNKELGHEKYTWVSRNFTFRVVEVKKGFRGVFVWKNPIFRVIWNPRRREVVHIKRLVKWEFRLVRKESRSWHGMEEDRIQERGGEDWEETEWRLVDIQTEKIEFKGNVTF